MPRLLSPARVAGGLLVLGSFAPVTAHDLWLEPAGRDSLALRYGHAHGDHAGATTVSYEPTIVLAGLCLDAGGAVHQLPETVESPYRFSCQGVAAHALTSSGACTQTPYGTRNVPPAQAERAIRSWRSYESAKRLRRWSPALARPLVATGGAAGGAASEFPTAGVTTELGAASLELVPLANPFRLEPGEKLRLRVVLAGAPLPDAIVVYDGKPRGRTNAEGEINIRLRHIGLQFLQASFTRAAGRAEVREVGEAEAGDTADGAANEVVDAVIYATSLTFDLGAKE